jgi:allantoicase
VVASARTMVDFEKTIDLAAERLGGAVCFAPGHLSGVDADTSHFLSNARKAEGAADLGAVSHPWPSLSPDRGVARRRFFGEPVA